MASRDLPYERPRPTRAAPRRGDEAIYLLLLLALLGFAAIGLIALLGT